MTVNLTKVTCPRDFLKRLVVPKNAVTISRGNSSRGIVNESSPRFFPD